MVDRLRRNLLIGVPAALALRPFAAAAQAPLRIEITEGVVEPMPFAVPAFVPDGAGGGASSPAQITQVVIDDLTGTGLFREIPAAAHIGKIANFDAPVAFADWKAINAQALITGAVGVERRPGAGALPALGRLRRRRRSARGCSSTAAPANWRRLAHKVADAGLFAADRRERLLRQPGRLHRRERAEGGAAQAARRSWTTTGRTR